MCLFSFWGHVSALGLVNLLSTAEVLICPWGDERNFRKGIVQPLNSSDLCQYLPFKVALIEVRSDF